MEAFVVNLTRYPQRVLLDLFKGTAGPVHLRILDEINARNGFSEPVTVLDNTITLPAYAIAHLQG